MFISTSNGYIYINYSLTDREELLKNSVPPKRPDDLDIPTDELEKQESNSNEDSVENAFEPIKNNESRFSHLEL